jgi:hypothetical protein
VRLADGSVPTGFSVSWSQSDGRAGMRIGFSRADGVFSIPNLAPGLYTVTAQVPGLGARQVAVAEVALSGADVAVALTLAEAAAARGRITFDTGSAPATLNRSSVRILADAVVPSFPPSQPRATGVREDWTFEIAGLDGSHRLQVTVPQGWMVGSLRHAGRDITSGSLVFRGEDVEDIEIQLTQRIAAIGGVVRDVRGQAVGDATVVVFAADRSRWEPGSRFLRAVRPDQDGRFTIDGLLAGRYMAVALDFLESGEETNPETLEQLRSLATGVTLNEGESRTLDLRVLPAP